MAKKNIEIIIGQKVAGGADPAKVGKTHPAPEKPAGEVSGHDVYRMAVECPWCGAINWIWYNTDVYLNYECWNCHNIFSK